MPVPMKASLLSVLLVLYVTADSVGKQMMQPSVRYAQSILPTPVLNTPEFTSLFGAREVKADQPATAEPMRTLEFIALPETAFTVDEVINRGAVTIYRVTTDDYPYPAPGGYYIDSRFVRTSAERPPDRTRRLPDKSAIIASLIASEGTVYLWGGNLREGIPQMPDFYPPPAPLTREERGRWMLQGLDCSGLLYQSTGGYTPRNTSALTTFGESVSIAHLSVQQIIEAVKPLDIIVWPGHVIIVLDGNRVIESRPGYDDAQAGSQGGVRIRKIGAVLSEIMQDREPANRYDTAMPAGQKQFVIRRWYPHRRHQ
jgi:cell wall-associated NlpC family hydrolase